MRNWQHFGANFWTADNHSWLKPGSPWSDPNMHSILALHLPHTFITRKKRKIKCQDHLLLLFWVETWNSLKRKCQSDFATMHPSGLNFKPSLSLLSIHPFNHCQVFSLCVYPLLSPLMHPNPKSLLPGRQLYLPRQGFPSHPLWTWLRVLLRSLNKSRKLSLPGKRGIISIDMGESKAHANWEKKSTFARSGQENRI